jgi:hypothetical protein
MGRGGGIKENDGGSDFNYDVFGKNFCKCHKGLPVQWYKKGMIWKPTNKNKDSPIYETHHEYLLVFSLHLGSRAKRHVNCCISCEKCGQDGFFFRKWNVHRIRKFYTKNIYTYFFPIESSMTLDYPKISRFCHFFYPISQAGFVIISMSIFHDKQTDAICYNVLNFLCQY